MFSPEPGVSIGGRYRLLKLIGQGGMGDVWEAEDRELEGPCAVKFIQPRMLSDREVRSRFGREAKVAARLRSPHAVQVLGVGEHEGVPYLAMELLEGETLSSRLQREGRLSVELTLEVLGQVARLLEKARELGIVHRDLKPDNIWMCAQAEPFVKVFDFGIAKTLQATLQTATGGVVGTPHYMSPEQVQGARAVDHRSDVWALGVIALECLSGSRPFEATALGGLLLKIMAGPDASVRELGSRVAPGLDEWVSKALAVQPAERFQSAVELVSALRGHLSVGPEPAAAASSSRPLHTIPFGVAARATPASAELSASTSRTEVMPMTRSQHGTGRRSRRWLVLALALAAGVVLVAGLSYRSLLASGGAELDASVLSAAPAPGAPSGSEPASEAPALAARLPASVPPRAGDPGGTPSASSPARSAASAPDGPAPERSPLPAALPKQRPPAAANVPSPKVRAQPPRKPALDGNNPGF